MVESAPHPLVAPPPGGLCWRRSERRRPGAGPEVHQELVVLHGLRGSARYLLDGAVHPLGPGVLLWALAGQRHVLLDDTPDFDMRVMLISERVLGQGQGPDWPPLHVSEQGALDPRCLPRAASDELEGIAAAVQVAEDPMVQATGLRWWLTRAYRHWQAAESQPARPVHPAVTRAVWMLTAHPEVETEALARHAGLSSGRLSRLFRAETGAGLSEFRRERRLDRAEALMAERRTTWLAAALEAGFGSYPAFWRAYHTRYGHGPREEGRADT